MHYLLSRSSPDVAGINPDSVIEPRFVNELENAGFFQEMKCPYGK